MLIATYVSTDTSDTFKLNNFFVNSFNTEYCGQYVPSSMVIPIVHLLQTKINEAKITQILSTLLKKGKKFECSKRLGQIENVSFLAITTILDPSKKCILKIQSHYLKC